MATMMRQQLASSGCAASSSAAPIAPRASSLRAGRAVAFSCNACFLPATAQQLQGAGRTVRVTR